MWTEAKIKQALDGNFWFFDQEGKIHRKFVENDWVPSFKNNAPFAAVVKSESSIKWLDESYDLILEMREDKMSWPMIADIFQAPVSTLTDYVKRMKRRRSLEAFKKKSAIKIEEVRRMKAAGWDYARIKLETGYHKQLIIDVLEE